MREPTSGAAPRLIIALAAAVLLLVPHCGSAQSRTARTIRIDSAALGAQATVAVLLPVDYDASMLRYPVLYLLHGGTQNHTAFPARSWFTKEASSRAMIVVMPYLQPVFFSSRNGAAPPVEGFLGRDLPAYIDANYRTVHDRHARAIAGISMGGYGATLLGLKRPDMFGTVGAISAALSTGDRETELSRQVAALTREDAPYFYIACGLQDPLLQRSRALISLLRKREIASELHEVSGGHNWDVWDPQVRAFFQVLSGLRGWGPQ